MAEQSVNGARFTESIVLDDEAERGRLRGLKAFLRLLGYVRHDRPRVALVFATMLSYTGTLVAIPWTIKLIIDGYIVRPGADLSGLDRLIAVFGLIVLLHYLSDYFYRRTQVVLGNRVLYALRVQLFAHLLRLSMRFYDRNQTGRVMSRVQNDVQQLQELLNIWLFAVANLVGLVGVTVAMLVMSLQLALITFASVLLIIPVLILWQRYARLSFLRARQTIADVNARLQESLSAIRVIQSLRREKVTIEAFRASNRENLAANLQAMKFWASLYPSVEALNAVGLALVVFYGGGMVLQGSLEVGVLVAFALYLQRFFEPIERLTEDYGQVQKAVVAVARTFEILDIEPALKDRPGAVELSEVEGAVRFEGVGFTYKGGEQLLSEIDLEINPGETVALVGPTGAGKTTMVSLLLRLYDVSEGRVTIDGHDLRDVTMSSLAVQSGVVPQEPFLFTGTVKQNIRYNNTDATDEEIVEAARAVGAHEFITEMEHGYDTELQQRGGNLSVGQRQLLSFARVLVADPRILILDEATANIDTQSEIRIQRAVGDLLKGRTALVIAHRLSTVRNADRIVVMDQGRIVEQGSHDELMAQGGLYARLQSYTTSEA